MATIHISVDGATSYAELDAALDAFATECSAKGWTVGPVGISGPLHEEDTH